MQQRSSASHLCELVTCHCWVHQPVAGSTKRTAPSEGLRQAIVRVASKSCTSQRPREVTRKVNTWDARAGSGHHHCWDAWDAGVIASGSAKTSNSAAQTQCSLVVPPAPQCAAGACPDRIRHHWCCPRGGLPIKGAARVTFIRQQHLPLAKRRARGFVY